MNNTIMKNTNTNFYFLYIGNGKLVCAVQIQILLKPDEGDIAANWGE